MIRCSASVPAKIDSRPISIRHVKLEIVARLWLDWLCRLVFSPIKSPPSLLLARLAIIAATKLSECYGIAQAITSLSVVASLCSLGQNNSTVRCHFGLPHLLRSQCPHASVLSLLTRGQLTCFVNKRDPHVASEWLHRSMG
jgi:hypothetical protein